MRSSLVDRLRGVVNVPLVSPQAQRSIAEPAEAPSAARSFSRTAAILGGRVVERSEGAVLVVDRHYAIDRAHGRTRVGDVVETIRSGADALAVLQRAYGTAPSHDGDREQLVFLDLETTGLAGGAGTQAFLIGCAVVDGDELLVRQFLLAGFEHERALLAEIRHWLSPHCTLVTFNGRSFDVPLIETRYLFHRLEFPFAEAPHIDMLHASRRLWKERPSVAGPPLDEDSCKLSVLERHLAGVHRVGDVPGFDIPSRFFRYVRDGNAFALQAVLEHNRIDLISLAVVTARAIRLIEQGPSATMHPRESLGLGRLYERAGMREHAEACYVHSAALAARVGREPDARAEALRRLALCRRRTGRTAEAAAAWAELATLPGCPSVLRREAREALAIHHEHKSKDLDSARMLVLDVLADAPVARFRAAAEHRLKRIETKLARSAPGPLLTQASLSE